MNFNTTGCIYIKVLRFCLKYISMWWIGLLNLKPANKFRPYIMWYPYCVYYFYRRFIPATNWTLTVFGGAAQQMKCLKVYILQLEQAFFFTYMRKKREIFVDKFKCCYLPRLYHSNLLNVKFGGHWELILLSFFPSFFFCLSFFLFPWQRITRASSSDRDLKVWWQKLSFPSPESWRQDQWADTILFLRATAKMMPLNRKPYKTVVSSERNLRLQHTYKCFLADGVAL